jgi:DNA (cytosine-5)-methyltransferase 1
MNVLDLFSGIGGFSLGLERAGMRTVAFCEIDPYCRGVLARRWSGVPCYQDVRDLRADWLRASGITADVICGGFPCQDISIAGRKAGIEGSRSGLWAEIIRLASELRPLYLIVENVTNLLAGPEERPGGWFGRVLGDLAEIGMDVEWHCIPAAGLGAHFVGDRVWIIASSAEAGRCRWEGCWPSEMGAYPWGRDEFERLVRLEVQYGVPAGSLGRISDGISGRVDLLRALGNAVVPQIPEIIGRAIMKAHSK